MESTTKAEKEYSYVTPCERVPKDAKVTVITNDNVRFETSGAAVLRNRTIIEIVERYEVLEAHIDVPSAIYKYILDYDEHHANDTLFELDSEWKKKAIVDEWDKMFVQNIGSPNAQSRPHTVSMQCTECKRYEYHIHKDDLRGKGDNYDRCEHKVMIPCEGCKTINGECANCTKEKDGICKRDAMYEVMNAANLLNNVVILGVCCKHLRDTRILGKTPPQLRDTLGLPDDMTDKEKAEVHKENGWTDNV
jgi:hypothetical protein